jgi:hypothetical protein
MSDNLGWLKKLLGIHRLLDHGGDVLPTTHTLSFEDSGIEASYNQNEGIVQLSAAVNQLVTGSTSVNDFLAAGAEGDYAVGCTGASVGDLPLVDFGSSGLPLGVLFGGAWCTGNNVNVRLYNHTGAGITMSSQSVNVGALRGQS